MINKKPISKPVCINFSSGPCTKRPGWSVNSLDNALLGRSHRSKEGKIKLKDALKHPWLNITKEDKINCEKWFDDIFEKCSSDSENENHSQCGNHSQCENHSESENNSENESE